MKRRILLSNKNEFDYPKNSNIPLRFLHKSTEDVTVSTSMPDETKQPLSKEYLGIPEVLVERNYKYLFGLISFWLLIEDRRPDLTEKQATQLLGHKYKIQLSINFFYLRTFSFILWTTTLGHLTENGNDIVEEISQQVANRPQYVSDDEFKVMLEQKELIDKKYAEDRERRRAESEKLISLLEQATAKAKTAPIITETELKAAIAEQNALFKKFKL